MSFPSSPSVALFGLGAFGQLLARLLAPEVPLCVHDPAPGAGTQATALGLPLVSEAEACRADILILAVPLGALEPLLTRLAPRLRPGQLVIDVASVKEEPARLMQALLPKGVEVLATHPMFGPLSAGQGVRGAQVVLCPLRGSRWRRVAAFLRGRHGLRLIVTTPAEHDAQAALSQGMTHLIGQALRSLGPAPRIRTRSFDLMMEALAMVASDAPEVYEAVTRGNAHVGPLRDRLVAALSETGGVTPR